MKRITRVRWNADERAAVVHRAQTLLADDPRLSLKALFSQSQECLPKERRRPSNPSASAWLHQEVKRAGPLPSPATVWRPERAAQDVESLDGNESAAPARSGTAATPPADATASPRAAGVPSGNAPPANASPLVALLVESGVQVISGILADPRVRQAFANLLSRGAPAGDAARSAQDGAQDLSQPAHWPSQTDTPQANVVVVAGCSVDEARSLAHELKGTLAVKFWTPDEPRERLLDLLPSAGLVVGVSAGLPQAVESSLARLGPRFVRHTGSAQALYRRLAEHALAAS